jgi:hypothetical protein
VQDVAAVTVDEVGDGGDFAFGVGQETRRMAECFMQLV